MTPDIDQLKKEITADIKRQIMPDYAMPLKENELPPRPGEAPRRGGPIKGTPVIVYINGEPVTMSKAEAMSAVLQIMQILFYLENQADEGAPGEARNG